jgi:alpha-glucosidase
MDCEGIYEEAGIRGGAFRNPESKYRKYFSFDKKGRFEAWYDIETLPKLNYDESPEVIEEIMRIGEKWAGEPYCIDGWRLDVGADLGHDPSVNHRIWKEFRQRVRKVNPDVLIIAEHYGDPSPWLEGDEWDTVMNYDAFMDPLSFFLTGMEKHSDIFRPDVYQNGTAFFNMMNDSMAHMPNESIYSAMNQLSNHDHSRFLTRTNSTVGRLQTAGSKAASENIRPGIFREAVVVQMTWPGAPTVYYGDEAGVPGWTDPDNRRTYPWGREDKNMIEMHRSLARLRKEHPMLRKGSIKPLGSGDGYISYARFDENSIIMTAVNNNAHAITVSLPLAELGVKDGSEVLRIFRTDEKGYDDCNVTAGRVKDGRFEFKADRYSSYVFTMA